MRFLADESCDFAVVRALRATGHDVLAVSEFQNSSVDEELMEMAFGESRVLLTEDKDFGWLAFVKHMNSAGVILIRFPAGARSSLATSIIGLVDDMGQKLPGAFVILRPGSVRISRTISND
jgi:predicted nuclease of predicted toxin-antitoxin system